MAVTDAIKAHLDTRGLMCPEPLIRTREALRSLRPGERLEILSDDPVAPLDFAVFCDRTGNPLRDSSKEGKVYRFVIEHK